MYNYLLKFKFSKKMITYRQKLKTDKCFHEIPENSKKEIKFKLFFTAKALLF